jgi:hypothetical protein
MLWLYILALVCADVKTVSSEENTRRATAESSRRIATSAAFVACEGTRYLATAPKIRRTRVGVVSMYRRDARSMDSNERT